MKCSIEKYKANLKILRDMWKVVECFDVNSRLKWRERFFKLIKEFCNRYDINEEETIGIILGE